MVFTQYSIGVIGAGNMAGAIINNALQAKRYQPAQIALADCDSKKLAAFAKHGCHTTMDNTALVSQSRIIILAVKPQQMKEVLTKLSEAAVGKTFVSIAAGLSTNTIREYLNAECNAECDVIRVMPNSSLLCAKGAVVIVKNNSVCPEIFDEVVSLFECGGMVEFLEENLINTVTSINGSGPAYFYKMAKVMIQVAKEHGIDEMTALKLTAKTMEGAAVMLLNSGFSPQILIDQVTSPGGSTIAALSSMDDSGFDDIVSRALLCCISRAEELGQDLKKS